MLEGIFRYQACDATTCYNPETLPVHFEVQVLKQTPSACGGAARKSECTEQKPSRPRIEDSPCWR